MEVYLNFAYDEIKIDIKLTVTCDKTLFVASLTQRFRFVLAKGLFRDLSAW